MEPRSGTEISINRTAPKENKLTQEIEKVTSKITPGSFLTLALGSLALSAGIATFSKRKSMANFVGLWVPTLMLAGIYNKIFSSQSAGKTQDMGSDKTQDNLH